MKFIACFATFAVPLTTAVAAPSTIQFDLLGGSSFALVQAGQQATLSAAEMDQLTAPIALYPDALLAQILMCAQSPYQVKQVDGWVKANPNLKGTEAQAAAQKQGFDASFIALVPFPQVLASMASQPEWTTKLGQQFTANNKAVFDSIQRLRAQAKSLGNLQTNAQQEVTTQTTASGTQVVVIQPANPQIVYVPTYSTTVVYTQPAPATATSSQVAGAAVVGFAAGVIVGAAVSDGDDYHYGWGYRGGCCYSEGWNNYSNYRSDMATQRQSTASGNQAARQDTASGNQSSRQDSREGNQSSRQDSQADNQASRSENQSNRQSSASGASSTRGKEQAGSGASSKKSGGSSAASGYGSGSSTKAASSRGSSSLQSARGGGGGGNRSGGGGGRSGGGGGGRR